MRWYPEPQPAPEDKAAHLLRLRTGYLKQVDKLEWELVIAHHRYKTGRLADYGRVVDAAMDVKAARSAILTIPRLVEELLTDGAIRVSVRGHGSSNATSRG